MPAKLKPPSEREDTATEVMLSRRRKKSITITLPWSLADRVDGFCVEQEIDRSAFAEAAFKYALMDSGGASGDAVRTNLRAHYMQLTQGMTAMEKSCGKHFAQIRKVYLEDLKGKPDGSNREEVLPKLYNHFGDNIEVKSVLPFFEQYVEFTVQAAEYLERLAKCGKEEKIEKERGSVE